MRTITNIFLLISLILTPRYAQTQDDTLDVLSLFPVHVGNRWQYLVTFDLDTSYSTVSITKDTIMPNGKKYYEFEKDDYYKHKDYFRVDSSELIVYKYANYYPCTIDSELILYNLDINNDSLNYCWYSFRLSDSTFGQVGLLPHFRIQYRYFWTDYDELKEHYLSHGFGLSSMSAGRGFGLYIEELIAAKIDNIFYEFFTPIEKNEVNVKNLTLYRNYPNPFNPYTNISFELPKPEHVLLEVYNVLGQKIKTLVGKKLSAGIHSVEFDGTRLGSGVYLYRIQTLDYSEVKKMILMK